MTTSYKEFGFTGAERPIEVIPNQSTYLAKDTEDIPGMETKISISLIDRDNFVNGPLSLAKTLYPYPRNLANWLIRHSLSSEK